MTSGFRPLVAAVRAGDERAFGLLWRATNPALLRYLRVVAPDRADALATQTWGRLGRSLAGFRGGEAEWRILVFRTARQCAKTAGTLTGPTGRPAPVVPRSLDDVVTEVALSLVAALPKREGEVLVLRTSARCSVADIADITRLGPAGVRAAAHSGLARAGVLAASPAFRDRIDRGLPPGESPDWARSASLPEPELAGNTLEEILCGRPMLPGAPRRWRQLAWIVSALNAPPAVPELAGSGPVYAQLRRQLTAGPKHARVAVALGSRVAVAAAVVSIGLSGTLSAAYAGVLPGWLQDVAHSWLDAPPADSDGRPATPHRSGGTSAGPGSVSPQGGTSPGSSGQGTGQPTPVPRTSQAPASTEPTRPAARTTAPGRTNPPPGTTKTPPGTTKTPPGTTKTPPGTTKTPPGTTKTPPGTTKTPPSTTKTPRTGRTVPNPTKRPPGRGAPSATQTTATQATATQAT